MVLSETYIWIVIIFTNYTKRRIARQPLSFQISVYAFMFYQLLDIHKTARLVSHSL